MYEMNTFSIAARCPRTGNFGVAVATAVPAVGSMCPYLCSGVGAVSTQSWVNPYLALSALEELKAGGTAGDALAAALSADERPDLRQIGLVGTAGQGAAWTGDGCTDWAGHHAGSGYAIQGNMLAGPQVIDDMIKAFESSADADLDERLMRVLEAGDGAGGDKRGKQSAALRIVSQEDYALLDVRVDEHPSPVQELRRVLTIARHQLLPFVEGMPKKNTPAREIPQLVSDMLLKPPPYRPGGGGSAPGDIPSGLVSAVIGLELEAARVHELRLRFEPVLSEIARLRAIDLSDVHPPIIFDPALPYT